MSAESKRRDLISRSWTRSHEEDEGERLVLRPTEYDFPPARGRDSFALNDDGTLELGGPGPDDRRVTTDGTWTLNGDRLELSPYGTSPRAYTVDDIATDRLVVVAVHESPTQPGNTTEKEHITEEDDEDAQ